MNSNPNYNLATERDEIALFYETDALKALIDVYLVAGLSHYDAVLSALADFECQLQPTQACAA